MKRLTYHSGAPSGTIHRTASGLTRWWSSPTTIPRAAPLMVAILAAAFIVEPALAELPTAVQAGSAASGDYIEIGKQYFKNGLIVLGLIIATLGFIAVAAGGIAKFNEYRIGRAELGDLGVLAVVGAVVLVLMVYLLNEAATIID